MTRSSQAVHLAVDSFSAREVPDDRTRVCELSVEETNGSTVVTGTVSTHGLAQRLFDLLREFPTVDRDASSVQVLADLATDSTATQTAVPVLSRPTADAEQVTQLLYGDEVTAYDARDGWRRVAAPDGYVGWVDDDALTAAEPIETNAVLRENVIRDRGENDPRDLGENDTSDEGEVLPIGTPCAVLGAEDDGDSVEVQFRTGHRCAVPEECISRPWGLPSGEEIVEVARQFAGTEYEWGGMTTEGIDCSGLVWVSYRVFGVELPRDTDQQQAVGTEVSRDELRPGDLLFFPGHVAISTGGARYVHAHGSSGGFVESSLDPDDEGYIADLDEGLTGCRRLLPEN